MQLQSLETLRRMTVSSISSCQDFIPPPRKVHLTMSRTVPSNAVWTVAKSSSPSEWLPEQRAQIYSRVDFEASEAVRIDDAMQLDDQQTDGLTNSLGIQFAPGEGIHLSVSQRDTLVLALEKSLALHRLYEVRLTIWQGASEAVVHNARTLDQAFPYIDTATRELSRRYR